MDRILAKKSNKLLSNAKVGYVVASYLRDSKEFDKITKKIIYVGCSDDLSSIFLFENASTYIHQDLAEGTIPKSLSVLEKNNIITDFQVLSDNGFRRESTFRYKDRNKRMIEYYDPRVSDDDEIRGSRSDIGLFTPREVKKDLEAIYFNGVPYPTVIKLIFINLLPYLRIGGILYGPYPYGNGQYEGSTPDKLGLRTQNNVSIKERNIPRSSIEHEINYTRRDYIDKLVQLLVYDVPVCESEEVTKRLQELGGMEKAKSHFYDKMEELLQF